MCPSKIEIIFSGVLGALIGSLVTILLYWHSRYRTSRRAIEDRLLILLHDVYWKKNTVSEAWDTTLTDIWLLHNAYLEVIPFWPRCRITRAWEQYKGIKKDVIKKTTKQGIIIDSKTPPENTDDLFHRIDSFLKAL